jgi:Kef-type K+ transport system membrane component KefB
MLATALLLGQLFTRMRQPAVLGEMIGGLILGPTIFGNLAPEWHTWLFPDSAAIGVARSTIIKFGALLFLFIVGLEIDLKALRRHGTSALVIGTIGSLVPLGAGVAVVYCWPSLWSGVDDAHRLAFALFFGACLANTANPVLARILLDLGLLKTDLGSMLMTATVVDDLLAWSLLPVVFAGASSDESVTGIPLWQSGALVIGLLVALLLFGHYVGSPLLRWIRRTFEWPTAFIGFVVVIVLASAAISEKLGLHAFLGPFLVGMALAPSAEERGVAYEVINQFAMSFFAPLYFLSLGLTSNFIADFDALLVGVVLVVACVSKIAGVYGAGRLRGMNSRTSLAVGFGMNARGATGIILAALGHERGILDDRTYVALVTMALVTSLMAGPAMKVLAAPQTDVR